MHGSKPLAGLLAVTLASLAWGLGCQGGPDGSDAAQDAGPDGGSDPGPGDLVADGGSDAVTDRGSDPGFDAGGDPGGGDPGVTCEPTIPAGTNILDQHEMLIVSNDALLDDFNPLAEWKRAKGVPTELVSTSWIAQNLSGEDLPAKIREYIRTKRPAGLGYVLLGGDSRIVSVRWVHSKSTIGGTEETFASDFYYSDLQGSWDENHNGTYGETDDDLDMHPEVAVGRAPVNTAADVQAFVDRVLAYEQTDPGEVKNALFISEDTGYLGLDSALQLNPLADDVFPADYQKTKLYWEYDKYPDSQENTLAAQIAALNAGQNFVTHYGHSLEDQLDTEMALSDVAALSNSPHFPIFVTCGCFAGNFAYPDILTVAGEQLLINPNGGAVAYLGNTNWGLGPAGGTDLIKAFYVAMFGGKLRLGEALDEARNSFYSNESSLQSEFYGTRWTQLVVVLLGDPEMPARTLPPATLTVSHDPERGSGEQCLQVQVRKDGAPLAGATVTLYRRGQYLYRQQTDASGSTWFRFVNQTSGQAQVTATFPQTIPAQSSLAIQ